jgi:hypothetical protein
MHKLYVKISIKEEGTLFVLFVSLDEISPITAPLVLLLVLFWEALHE